MGSLSHVLLTRFNLAMDFGGKAQRRWLDEAWLQDRVRLFERYCYPSVLAQTCQDFTWLVLCDEASPLWLTEWLQESCPRATAIRVTDARRETLEPHLPNCEWLLSTRLDSDDALHRDFIGTVQSYTHEPGRTFLDPVIGYTLSGNRFYRRTYRNSPFLSLMERRERASLVYSVQHQEASRYGPVVPINGGPMWVQVIHGDNVSNSVVGTLDRSAKAEEFGLTLGDCPRLAAKAAAKERALAYLRGTGVTHAARQALVRIAGRISSHADEDALLPEHLHGRVQQQSR